MAESQQEPAAPENGTPATTAPGAEPVTAVTEQSAAPSPAPRRRRRRAVILSSVGVVVLAAALAGGLVVGLRPSHHHVTPTVAPPRPVAPSTTPPATGFNPDGTPYGPLASFLVPIPSGYALGPYDGDYGNDGAISPQQLAAANNEAMRSVAKQLGLSNSETQQGLVTPAETAKTMHAAVIAMRSDDTTLDISLELRQFSAISEARDMAGGDEQFLATAARIDGRSQPSVPGYGKAHCAYLMPVTHGLDELDCVAVTSSVVAYFTVQGVAPIPNGKVLAIFTDQLKRLTASGASA